MTSHLRKTAKDLLGPRATVWLRSLLRGRGLPRWGNLRRLHPFSENFGFDRGTPIDRYYLDRFLAANRAAIRGDVLEIQLPDSARRYGTDLGAVHTVDINPAFRPTYACDLALAEGVIPDERYDCFLLPNTLSFLRDLEGSLRQALRVIRPGGTILASSSAFVPLVPDMADYWRLSAAGWREVAERAWPGCAVEVTGHGNCLAAVASMLALAWEELTPRELDSHDPRYPVLVTLSCRKPERGEP
jgi:hypothetical protein